ncbi:MAG: hypothetical protein ACKV2Q_14475 [Planctomycetaceae bacterium]
MSAETIPELRAKLNAKDVQIEQLETELWLAQLQIKAMRSNQPTGIPAVDRDLAAIRRKGVPPALFGLDRMSSAMRLPSAKPSIPATINQTFRKIRAPFAFVVLWVASWCS